MTRCGVHVNYRCHAGFPGAGIGSASGATTRGANESVGCDSAKKTLLALWRHRRPVAYDAGQREGAPLPKGSDNRGIGGRAARLTCGGQR